MGSREIKDEDGNTKGVYIPIEEWELIKGSYPDIENLEEEIPQWQKDLLDQRIEESRKHPELLLPIEKLFEFLDSGK